MRKLLRMGLVPGECEEGKQWVLRPRSNEAWTDKHRHVMRKLIVEAGRVQKRLHRIGLEKREQSCRNVEGGAEVTRRKSQLHSESHWRKGLVTVRKCESE